MEEVKKLIWASKIAVRLTLPEDILIEKKIVPPLYLFIYR